MSGKDWDRDPNAPVPDGYAPPEAPAPMPPAPAPAVRVTKTDTGAAAYNKTYQGLFDTSGDSFPSMVAAKTPHTTSGDNVDPAMLEREASFCKNHVLCSYFHLNSRCQ